MWLKKYKDKRKESLIIEKASRFLAQDIREKCEDFDWLSVEFSQYVRKTQVCRIPSLKKPKRYHRSAMTSYLEYLFDGLKKGTIEIIDKTEK